jgi:hypothetical protein
MFQMLTEVIGAEELLRLIALAGVMNVMKMFGARLPAWRISEFLTTVTADVYAAVADHRRMESGFRTTDERSTRPRVAPEM